MDEPREGYTGVGRVLRPHGLKGEVRVQVFNPAAPNLQASRLVYVAGQRRRVLRARNDHDAWILQLTGLTNRDQVEGLRNHLVEVKDADLRRDDDDSYFVHELIGLRVVTDTGRELGTITEVIYTGANDVYVVKGDGKEYLIPAIAQVVARIDLPVSVMTVTPMPGLLDESE
jgi:16S rRNA processing protein RimM